MIFGKKKVQTFTIYTILCHYLLTITLQLTYRFTFCKLQGEGTPVVLLISDFVRDIVRYMLERMLV